MENQNTLNKKWYDNKVILILLFFVLPPLGIYAMVKHKTDVWKKIVYIIPACFLILFTVIGIVGSFMIDNYKNGMDYYNKQEYVRAYESFKLVNQSSENYNDAISKIQEIQPIIDSINTVKEQKKLAKQEEEKQKRLEKEKKKEEKQRQKELEDNPSVAYHEVQRNFLKILEQSEQEYEDAPNELKKSAVRTKRGNLIKECLGNTRKFSNWIGVVSNMRTTGKGKAIFEIEIEGTGINIGTMNNEFSDLFGGTLIEQSSSLYKTISELEKGDKVIVNGSFISSDNNDYIYERSITESGSMRSPDFIAKFTKIEKQ